MKLFTRLALLLAIMFGTVVPGMAQTNFALSSEGSTATSTFTDDANAMLAIDGNTGSRWEAPQGKFKEEGVKESDCQWTLNMGRERHFNRIEILWEGAYSKSFTIEASTDGVTYTNIVSVTDVNPSSLLQDYDFEYVDARYLKFTNVARGTQYGCSFFEFRVLDRSEIPDVGEKINITPAMVVPMEGTSTTSLNGAFDAKTTGSEWQLVDNPSDATRDKVVGFTIDLGAYYDLRAINMCYEGASSQDYQVYVGTDKADTEIINVEGEGGIKPFTDYRVLENCTNVRFVKYVSTKAGTGWGVKLFDFSLFGYKTGEIVDNNAPTAVSATVAGLGFAHVNLALSATDDVSTVIAYEITYRDGETTKTATTTGASGATVNYTISELASSTEYTFNVIAKDRAGNEASAAPVTATTTALSAAPAHMLGEGETALPIYSDAYNNTPGFNWKDNNWGQHTAISEIEINGDHALMMQNTNYQGLTYQAINFEGATKLHVDVYPVDCTSLRITPIFWNPTANANFPEVPYVMSNLTPNQWNSIDIPMTAFGKNHAFINHQIKFDEGGDHTFVVDNIFYIKSETTSGGEPGGEPSEEPGDGGTIELTAADWATVGDNYAPKATIKIKYNENKTLTMTAVFEEEHVDLVARIKDITNGNKFSDMVNKGGSWEWTSTDEFEVGDVFRFTIYAPFRGGLSETKELTYKVAAEVGGEIDPPAVDPEEGSEVNLTAEDWVTADGGYAPNAKYSVVYNPDRTVTVNLKFEEEHVGLVPQIKIIKEGPEYSYYDFERNGDGWSWTSPDKAISMAQGTFENGKELHFTIYAAHREGLSETKELTYKVEAEKSGELTATVEEDGSYTLSGDITAANHPEELKNESVMIVDATAVTGEGELTLSNTNAFVIVSEGSDIRSNANIVVKSGDNYSATSLTFKGAENLHCGLNIECDNITFDFADDDTYKSNDYRTAVLPFAVANTQGVYEYLACDGINVEYNTPTGAIEAYKPIIIKCDEFTGFNGSDMVANNENGKFNVKELNDGIKLGFVTESDGTFDFEQDSDFDNCYVYGFSGATNQFVYAIGGFTAKPLSAFFMLPKASAAQGGPRRLYGGNSSMGLVIDGVRVGTMTGINDIDVDNDNEQYYNLLGQPVDRTYRGVVICKGKKIIVR